MGHLIWWWEVVNTQLLEKSAVEVHYPELVLFGN